jgi:hypothetical protein
VTVQAQLLQPSIKKVTIARPRTSQQSDEGLLTRVGIDYSLHPKIFTLVDFRASCLTLILFEKIVKVLFILL